jgi:hypothetical protein
LAGFTSRWISPFWCAVEGGRDLLDDGHGPSGVQRTVSLDQGLQVGSLHVSHGDVQEPIRFAGVVHGDHVRMVDGGGQLRLPEEPGSKPLVAAELWSEDLEGSFAPKLEVLGQVHHTHATPPDDGFDPVSGKLRADSSIHAGSPGRVLPSDPPQGEERTPRSASASASH